MIDAAHIAVYHWVWCKCIPCIRNRMKEESVLITLKEWLTMSPITQGYVWYMQAEQPGSELKDCRNPYEAGTTLYTFFEQGVQRGILEAQDSEE